MALKPTLCLMEISSAGQPAGWPTYRCREPTFSFNIKHLPDRTLPAIASPTFYHRQDKRLNSSTMSGFFSSNAEAALTDEEARHLFYQNQAGGAGDGTQGSGSAYQQQWTTGQFPGMASGSAQEPFPSFSPPQYTSWPTTAYPQLQSGDYSQMQYPPMTAPTVPSSHYTAEPWPNAPWPSLHPDDVEAPSDVSRSTSPNPADLHNFGVLLPDGRSWRCAYSGCTSEARFTRGCDLRKHYRRHAKSLFCRDKKCPQSKEGGFSSNKDRVSTVCYSSPPVKHSNTTYIKRKSATVTSELPHQTSS